ncbi:hypothetical protein GF337_01605 [candidate division KSB1 bacterium]|nr:hypothetical protein [candidate division KSB1 bacterium]
MISLLLLVSDLFHKIIRFIKGKFLKIPVKRKIIKIYRLPPRKVLHAHQLGLTIGLITVFFFLFVNDLTVARSAPLIISLIFIVGTFAGGPFVILAGLLVLFSGSINTDFSYILKLTSQSYLSGYLFGLILGTLYNDLVFLYLKFLKRDAVKLAFAFDPNLKLNIIKSPYETEEKALLETMKPLIFYTRRIAQNSENIRSVKKIHSLIRKTYYAKMITAADRAKLLASLPVDSGEHINEKLDQLENKLTNPDDTERLHTVQIIEENIEPLVEKYLKLKSQKLYNYDVKPASQHPYTIAFIANPAFTDSANASQTKTDPIIKNIDLFISSVDKALMSFETDHVLGRPEIWSQIRIVAIFDDELTTEEMNNMEMVQPYQGIVEIDGKVADNLLDTKADIVEKYKQLVEHSKDSAGLSPQIVKKINDYTDVIYAMSAVERYTRSTARYSDYLEKFRLFGLSYKLLERLKIIPGSIIESLKKLNQIEYRDEEEFLVAVAEIIGDDQTKKYKDKLIIAGKFPDTYPFTLTASSFEYLAEMEVPDSIINKLKILSNKEFFDFEDYLKATIETIGTAQTENFFIPLLKSGLIPHGSPFIFDQNPDDIKDDEIYETTRTFDITNPFTCLHDYYAKQPGRVAINVLEASSKTYIHEFGHAMSSVLHGAIVDEYYDRIIVRDSADVINSESAMNSSEEKIEDFPFCVNYIERKPENDREIIPVHKIFARYNGNVYHSDLHHPSAEENWKGYFPDRITPYSRCIMDRNYNDYRFDELLSCFMYDRLITKINRP